MPTFDSCTKCTSSQDMPGSQPVSCIWLTSELDLSLICKLRRSLMCLAYVLTSYSWICVQPGTGRRPVDWCSNHILYCTWYTGEEQC